MSLKCLALGLSVAVAGRRDATGSLSFQFLRVHFGVRLGGDLSQKRSKKSLLLIGPLRVDVATCCDENQIFRQEVDAALVSSVEKKKNSPLAPVRGM